MRTAVMLAVLGLAGIAGPGHASTPAYELRIVNAAGGPVQVRLPGGPWKHLGKVVRPAVRTVPGFAAARWAARGSVAAVAVHGHRIIASDGEFPATLSIIPRQFAAVPKRYGGHVPADSAIVTDIGAGESLFREWAPLVGSPVSIEFADSTRPLPEHYAPAAGDVLRITVAWPDDAPQTVTFENRVGGSVTATSADGRAQTIGAVTQPVRGVGRFDGTSYTGIGAVNTNHPGVITIGTAPVARTGVSEGDPPERRGGFMIQPSAHARDSNNGTPQMMGVAPAPGSPPWEGRFPLFSGCVGLHPGFRAEMSVDNGDWQPFPLLVGRLDDAFAPAQLTKTLGRPVTTGLTAIRLTLAPWNPATAVSAAAALPDTPSGKEPTGVYDPVSGLVPLRLRDATGPVTFFVDGAVRAVSNDPGYVWGWDTSLETPGRHWIEVSGHTTSGPKRILRRVVVVHSTP
jgi:hypothetical protein